MTTTGQSVDGRELSPSRLEFLHAIVFTVGFFALFAGIALSQPVLLLVSGPCLSLSGVLSLIGMRISFSGVLGNVLRVALGPARVASVRMRALAWLLIGLLVTVAGVVSLRSSHERAPLTDPTFSTR